MARSGIWIPFFLLDLIQNFKPFELSLSPTIVLMSSPHVPIPI